MGLFVFRSIISFGGTASALGQGHPPEEFGERPLNMLNMAKTAVKAKNSLKFPCIDVVEASAGSGKTYALAKRYIQLILNPNLKTEDMPLKSILAITFTNKATIEMKQRILEFLRMIAFDAFSSQLQRADILSSLTVDPEAAGKMAYEAMNDIIGNYNFYVRVCLLLHRLLLGQSLHLFP